MDITLRVKIPRFTLPNIAFKTGKVERLSSTLGVLPTMVNSALCVLVRRFTSPGTALDTPGV